MPLLIPTTALSWATTMTLCSVNDTNYLPYCNVYSRHTKQPIEKVFVDKGYLPSVISLRDPPPTFLKQSIDKWSHRTALGKNNQGTKKEEDYHNWKQPEALSNLQELPEFADN